MSNEQLKPTAPSPDPTLAVTVTTDAAPLAGTVDAAPPLAGTVDADPTLAGTVEAAPPLAGTVEVGGARAQSRFRPGARVGEYFLERQLGEGAMGTVYLARHAYSGIVHALKIARFPAEGHSPTRDRRFLREAETLAKLNHPGIVRVHSFSVHRGVGLLSMDALEGEDLDARLCSRGPLSAEEVVDFGGQLAAALAHMHAAGLVHRDVKPSNVIVRADTGGAVLCDFGIVHDMSATRLTSTKQLIGTPLYMAPELIVGNHAAVGPHTDVFAWGATAYRLLSGRHPFGSEGWVEVSARVLNVPPEPLPEAPRALAKLIARTLARDPAKRPTAAELVRILPALSTRDAPFLRLAAALGAALLLALAGSFAVLRATRTPPPSPTQEAPPPPPPSPLTEFAQVDELLGLGEGARALALAQNREGRAWARRRTLANLLVGGPVDEPLLLGKERVWFQIEGQRRELRARLAPSGAIPTREENLSTVSAGLHLANQGVAALDCPTLGPTLSERLCATLVDVVLSVRAQVYEGEGKRDVEQLVKLAQELRPGDPRPEVAQQLLERCKSLQAGNAWSALAPPPGWEGLIARAPRWAKIAWASRLLGSDWHKWDELREGRPGPLLEFVYAGAARPSGGTYCEARLVILADYEASSILLEALRKPKLLKDAAWARRTWGLALASTRMNLEASEAQLQRKNRVRRFAFAHCLLMGRRPQAALDVLTQISLADEDYRRSYLEAEAAMLLGDLERAEQALQTFDARRKQNYKDEWLAARVALYLLQGARREAEEAFAKLGPTRPHLYWRSKTATQALLASGRDARQTLWDALEK